jgi:aldehyde:ferredoxin oxidoreductase
MKARPGYTGKIARVDLSTETVSEFLTEAFARDYIGGRGMAAGIYYDEVPPQVSAFDPENRLIFATGPCAGFNGLAGARWVVCGKSPATDPQLFTHSNLGGSWGAELKSAGFDGLVVQGQAEKPAYLSIEDGQISIHDASILWGKGAIQVREILKNDLGRSFKVVATGPGGDNLTALATLVADSDACGTGSLGAVMGSKNLKAIAVRGSGIVKAAHPGRLRELLDHASRLKKNSPLTQLQALGTNQPDPCRDCTDECSRGVYEAGDGSRGKFMCQSRSFYKKWADSCYDPPTDVLFHASRLCNDYGLNSKSVEIIITWLDRCQHAGLLTDKDTGLDLSKIGSLDFLEALLESIAHRRGFGEILAQGLPRAAETVGSAALELVGDIATRAGEKLSYAPKAFLTTGLLYAMDPRQPIQQLHEIIRLVIRWVRWVGKEPQAHLSSDVFRAIARRFWGSELGADFSTYEGKALAAKKIQDRRLAQESLVLCDNSWPIFYAADSPDHVGDPSLESKILSSVTGSKMTEDEYYRAGERIFNLQRAILVREGHRGREYDRLPEACFSVPLETERLNPDCLMPGKDGEVISRKGAVFAKDRFNKMLGEFYDLRGWDRESGLQKKDTLEEMGLGDIAQDLAAKDLVKK